MKVNSSKFLMIVVCSFVFVIAAFPLAAFAKPQDGGPRPAGGGGGHKMVQANPRGAKGGPAAGPRFEKPDKLRPHQGLGEGRGLHRGENPPGPMGGPGSRPGFDRRADRNEDRQVDRFEHRKAGEHFRHEAMERFKDRADRNGDGVVGPHERMRAKHFLNERFGGNPPGPIGGPGAGQNGGAVAAGLDSGPSFGHMNPPGPAGGPGMGPRFRDRMDSNEDGRIDRFERQEAFEKFHGHRRAEHAKDRADRNDDGRVDRFERHQARDVMKNRFDENPPGPKGGPGAGKSFHNVNPLGHAGGNKRGDGFDRGHQAGPKGGLGHGAQVKRSGGHGGHQGGGARGGGRRG